MTAQTDNAPVLLDISEGIATIRFNRPDSLNAVDVEMACLFRDLVAQVVANSAVRVIVLAGNGRAFVAGGDLGYFRSAGENAPQAARELIAPMHAAVELLINAPQPVIGSLHGAVAGAGMSLAAAVDLAIAADNAIFNLAYIKIGNSPDCGASWTLPRVLGLRKAMEIALLAEAIDANEAHRIGLVNRVVPLDKLAEETAKIASKLAKSAPAGIASTKRLLNAGFQNSLHQQLGHEADSFASNAGTHDFREALDAFFEKRKPEFQGR
ncbi:MAG: paaG [Verrucomicrobiaceae bacterium]|nr:paaG [Verrucomicrobiaceae bacterium]